ncbi:MAG: TIGR01777 family oxidoreductase [Desulfococcaceae bacterium]
MKVFVTGGSGFVGTRLLRRLLAEGHETAATGTRAFHPEIDDERLRYITADTTRPGDWQTVAAESDAAVNLAGRSIFAYWTESHKQKMYDSRILTTRNLAAVLPAESVLVSASGVGIYGADPGDEAMNEDSPPGDDFMGRMAVDWENEALAARDRNVRVAATRFGVVLGRDGGAMRQMLPPFRMGLGGPIGDGEQWFPWIHIDDLISAILFLIEKPSAEGPFNFVAPENVRQKEFARTLGRVLNRPAFLPMPGFVLRMALGDMSNVLLGGQRAVPEALQTQGYGFQYPELAEALREIAA